MKRIGIYSGTFNPVHAGHISFALQAIEAAKLDMVYLLPERHRSNKTDVAHFGHRVAMIRQAIKPHRQLGLLESVEVSFTINKTLPRLQAQLSGNKLAFLVGSDSLRSLGTWPRVERLLGSAELIVGVRAGDQADVATMIAALPLQPESVYVIDSYAAAVSSTKIREALRRQKEAEGILASVKRYSNQNWLYISLA